MSETQEVDYFQSSINHYRHSIRGIEDSYNNAWDIYAELIQNSVDAIRLCGEQENFINIEVDCLKKEISITDGGIGIDKKMLPELLRPFGTNKSGVDDAIGEKGVGLKFVIFSSENFYIKTGNKDGVCEAEISGASVWKNRKDEQGLKIKVGNLESNFNGTLVKITGVDKDEIFNISFEQFRFLLRTRTALGTTRKIWGEDKNIKVTIYYKDINSKVFSEEIPFSYFLVTDNLKENDKMDLDEFENWLRQADRTDQEKIKKLRNKVIYKKGEFSHSNQRKIKYFACFVPKRRSWDDLSLNLGLVSEADLSDSKFLSDYFFCKLNSGITVSVKGMPTGIQIDHPSTGSSGYWFNLFIIFEDPFVKFDIGRKSIHGKQSGILKEYSRRVFNDFLQYVDKYVSGDIEISSSSWNRDEIFAEIDRIVDLNIDGIKMKKVPSDQEATVAAIFFECIGSGKIKDITPLISGYRNKYDLFALWGNRKLVFEFKAKLSGLVRDFSDARKLFDEIDCVVCWEITDKDKQALSNIGVTLEETASSMFGKNPNEIPHSTHQMSIANFSKTVFVIDLKRFLSKK